MSAVHKKPAGGGHGGQHHNNHQSHHHHGHGQQHSNQRGKESQQQQQRRYIQYVPAQKLSNGSISSVQSNQPLIAGLSSSSSSSSSANKGTVAPVFGKTKPDNTGTKDFANSKNTLPTTIPKAIPASTVNTEIGLFPPHMAPKYLRWLKVRRIGPGFYNEGNTCFLNSTLQCLLYLPTFSQCLLLEGKDALKGIRMGDEKNRSVIEMYSNLVKDVWGENGGNGRAISPRAMVNCIRRIGKQFKPFRQEDAHEYLRQLLDFMHEELLRQNGLKISDGKKAETSVISRVFGGYLCNTLTCTSCKYTSKTFNHFQDLSLEIRSGIQSIENAIEAFTKIENLTQGNEWKCDGCKKKVKATKQMTVQEVPNVLTLHLKRFSFGNMFGKITKHINFPVTLNVPYGYTGSSKNANHAKYDLTGVIVHHGSSTHSGHYIAYVKAPNGQWHEMNDSTVSVVSVNKVLQAQAYVLFYTRVPSEAEIATNKPKEEVKKPEPVKAQPPKPVEEPVTESSSEESSSSTEEEDEDEDEDSQMSMDDDDDDDENEEIPFFKMYAPFRFTGAINRFRQWKIQKNIVPIYKLGPILKERAAEKASLTSLKRGREEMETIKQEKTAVESESDSESESESEEISSQDEGTAIDEIPSNPKSTFMTNNGAASIHSSGSKDVVAALLEQSRRGRNLGGEGVWETVSGTDQEKIHQIAVLQRRKDQDSRKQKKLSDWDMLLDQGKTKKVKTHHYDLPEPTEPQDKYSPFQRVLDEREQAKAVQGSHVDMRFDPIVKHNHRKKPKNDDRRNSGKFPSKFNNNRNNYRN